VTRFRLALFVHVTCVGALLWCAYYNVTSIASRERTVIYHGVPIASSVRRWP